MPTAVPMLGQPIIRDELKPRSASQTMQFDPEKHLGYASDPKTFSLSDMGVISEQSISSVAISEPFPLFTEEAVQAMRSELFTQEVWENCKFSTEFAHCQIRDYCDKCVLSFIDSGTACR